MNFKDQLQELYNRPMFSLKTTLAEINEKMRKLAEERKTNIVISGYTSNELIEIGKHYEAEGLSVVYGSPLEVLITSWTGTENIQIFDIRINWA